MNSAITIRPLTPADLPFADSVRALASWNQTIEDWKRLLALSADRGPGCFLAEWGGAPAGTATTICYGQEVAWIGMVLVHPALRGRGLGKALLGHCLDYLEQRGIPCVKLDATPAGERLYRQLGFLEEWPLARWKLEPSHPPVRESAGRPRRCSLLDRPLVAQLDQRAFGASRSALLESLARDATPPLVLQVEGSLHAFGMLRDGASARYLGPLAARSAGFASKLVKWLLGCAAGQPVYWDIPETNLAAVALASELGFTRQRPLLRMVRGQNTHPGNSELYFAIADPALG